MYMIVSFENGKIFFCLFLKMGKKSIRHFAKKWTICITFGCECKNENVLIKAHMEFSGRRPFTHIWLQISSSSQRRGYHMVGKNTNVNVVMTLNFISGVVFS